MSRAYPHPRNWSEMSTDFKAMFGFHVAFMLVSINAGTGALSLQSEIIMADALLAMVVIISVWRKLAAGWRWPGVDSRDVVRAFVGLGFTAIFLFAGTPLAPPLNPRMFPWYVMGGAIGLFAVLHSFKLVTTTEEEFQTQCRANTPSTAAPPPEEKAWKRVVGSAYMALFVAICLEGLASSYFFGLGVRGGSHEPTVQNTELIRNHSELVYVTAQTKHLIDMLRVVQSIGSPAVLLLGAILQFGLKIHVFTIRGSDRD